MTKPNQMPLFRLTPSVRERKRSNDLFALKLTPEEKERYDEVTRESDAKRVKERSNYTPIGEDPYDIEVLTCVNEYGRPTLIRFQDRPKGINRAIDRLKRHEMIQYNNNIANPWWWMTAAGKNLLAKHTAEAERN